MGKQSKRERKEEEAAKSVVQEEGLSPADKRFAGTLNYIARGVIIGGSVAVMVGLFVPGVEMARIVGLGLLCGCLAGVTMKNINDRKQGR